MNYIQKVTSIIIEESYLKVTKYIKILNIWFKTNIHLREFVWEDLSQEK